MFCRERGCIAPTPCTGHSETIEGSVIMGNTICREWVSSVFLAIKVPDDIQ